MTHGTLERLYALNMFFVIINMVATELCIYLSQERNNVWFTNQIGENNKE